VDYSIEIRARLGSEGILDERFIDGFFRRHGDFTPELARVADISPEHLEDELQGIVETAKGDYLHYFVNSKTESGEIRPERAYRRRKKSRTADAWDRQAALAKYLTARMRPSGSALVGGQLLSPEGAEAFLDSPLAASYPTGFITHYGLNAMLTPVVVGAGEDKRGPYRTLQARGELGTRIFKIRPLGWTVKGPVFPGHRFEGLDLAEMHRAAKAKVGFVLHPHNPNAHIVVRAKSVLARLNEATNRMQGEPISPEKALWLILTGEFIPEPPVRIGWERTHTPGWYRRARITLEVEGWMSAEEVAGHYRHAQRQVFGKIPRSLDAKSCVLLDFVNQNKGMMTWEELYEKWNKEHPVWRFKQVGHLHQLHKNAFRKLTGGN